MTDHEYAALMADTSKRIAADISWTDDEDHSPTVEFRVEVSSNPGYPLFVRGSYNRQAHTLAFVLIHKGHGRIYGLCLGKDHHNPSCEYVGDKHKHSWSETARDKNAYVPTDITAAVDDPALVWQQFCAEANITHEGTMHQPPPEEGEPF